MTATQPPIDDAQHSPHSSLLVAGPMSAHRSSSPLQQPTPEPRSRASFQQQRSSRQLQQQSAGNSAGFSGMRPPIVSGPSSHLGHSSSSSPQQGSTNYKSQSAHGHGSALQPSYPLSSPGLPGYGLPPSSSDFRDELRPLNPPHSRPHSPPTRSNSADDNGNAQTSHSFTSAMSPTPNHNPSSAALCSSCRQPMSGQFVRALGTVFHLDCFRCGDCNIIVASKFFPIDTPEGTQQPLCERDYFRRLGLICGKCEQALRGSYITACNKKFHVEHFTCSVCPTLFGPQDSYYEHGGDVYCHFHYSTRFATKCVGCSSAILKQFVEINRNMKDECWHPECYMIHKFWNVKVASKPLAITESEEPPTNYTEEEDSFNAISLKDRQAKMETLVYRIWTHLSAFEESSAACISDMLRHVSNGAYLDAIRMAEKFILHVEVLFAAIDELDAGFAKAQAKGMSHVREARMLCRKTVDLFTLLSHTQDSASTSSSTSNSSSTAVATTTPNQGRQGMTQELLALVTGLAHYLKILIRIALTGALKLEREYNDPSALLKFLDRLQALALAGADPSNKRLPAVNVKSQSVGVDYSEGVAYGYRSLGPECAGESPFGGGAPLAPPSDLCSSCKLTVEEDCVRLGTYQRWHSQCVKCATCGKAAAVPTPPRTVEEKEKDKNTALVNGKDASGGSKPKISSARRPPANVDEFRYDTIQPSVAAEPKADGKIHYPKVLIYCTTHASSECRSGFRAVSRLEQYSFLLNVALRRLYLLLHKRGVMQTIPGPSPTTPSDQSSSYRDSADILRMKSSVHLDRKLSATARIPKRSTIIESPSGKVAEPTGSNVAHRPQLNQPSAEASRSQISVPTQRSSNRGGAPPPRPPPPNIPPLNQHDPVSPSYSPVSPNPGSETHVIRPAFARGNTQVLVVDERNPEVSAVDGGKDHTESPLGENFHEDDGLTLADIPQLLGSEQHRQLPSNPFIAELSPLELVLVKALAVLSLQRSPLRDQMEMEDIYELIEVKKSGFWNKLFKGNDKKNVKKKGVFGVPLELLAEQGTDSMLGSSRAPLRVPIFIDDVISAMRQMDMSVEGIFRKNGNIRRLKELTDAMDREAASVDLSQENPVQLAALMKKFLRDLPDPMMTFKLHRLWNAVTSLQMEEERKRCLHMLCIILPKSHRDTMEALFVFLKWVASFSHVDEETGSKMDLQNLATVICPSILYAKGREAAREDSFTAIPVVTELLEDQDRFYTVPDDFMAVLKDQDQFANAMDMPCKDLLRKLEGYQRYRNSGRTPNPGQNGQGMSSSSSNGALNREDGRLVGQRSDPAITRGRLPGGGDGLRSPPPIRIPNASRSKERKQSNPDTLNRAPPSFQQVVPSPGPSSPQQKGDAAWSNHPGFSVTTRPSPIPSGSRPSSWARPNGEPNYANGRQSPAGRF